MINQKRTPNIVVILTDDQGAWAMGCAGNPDVKTPNLDRLAETGVRFDNFFCTSPVCSPSRASLFTGKMPSQHGIHDWLRGENDRESGIEYLQGQTSYTDILAQNNYTCGISGKWHLGHSAKPQKSFSHWYVHEGGSSSYYNAPMIRNGKLVHEEEYVTDVITDDGIDFIKRQSKEPNPFYLSVHYTAPHSPWINQHPKEYVELYDDYSFESCPKNPEHPWSTTNTRDSHEESLAGYFASITAMDHNVGRIIDTLEELKLRDDTLICFLSDNGFNFGHHGIWGKGNGTFPQNMYDTSVKVPAIMSQPGRIPQNIVNEELVSGYDFMPTILDFVGLDNPDAVELPGSSFLPYLIGDRKQMKERRKNIVIYDEYGPVRMIRTKEWKYIHRYPYGPHELYDLIADPAEEDNLINDESRSDIVTLMKKGLEEWFVKYVDPEIDGIREPVKGAGQSRLSGINSKGEKVYYEWD